jgi:hypothetical protein
MDRVRESENNVQSLKDQTGISPSPPVALVRVCDIWAPVSHFGEMRQDFEISRLLTIGVKPGSYAPSSRF